MQAFLEKISPKIMLYFLLSPNYMVLKKIGMRENFMLI
jgi:hypothetical protein